MDELRGLVKGTDLRVEGVGLDVALVDTRVKFLEDRLGVLQASVDRLLALLEPAARRMRVGAPPVQDWEAMQRENLKQFEEE